MHQAGQGYSTKGTRSEKRYHDARRGIDLSPSHELLRLIYNELLHTDFYGYFSVLHTYISLEFELSWAALDWDTPAGLHGVCNFEQACHES